MLDHLLNLLTNIRKARKQIVMEGLPGEIPNSHLCRQCFYNGGPLTDREKRPSKNAVVQMLEADVFKITMLRVSYAFRTEDLPAKMVLLLRDGIWFTCSDKHATVARVSDPIKKIMENSAKLSVPLKVELN